jgi:hypothetical protein
MGTNVVILKYRLFFPVAVCLYRLFSTLGSINGGYIPEDARSHISHLSQNRGPKSRATSIADLTGKPPYPVLGMGLTMSRPGNIECAILCKM